MYVFACSSNTSPWRAFSPKLVSGYIKPLHFIIKNKPPEVRQRLAALPMESIVISVVTQAELLFGLAKKGSPASLKALIDGFLLRVEVLPWDDDCATVYGDLRASCEASGITLGALDMMIAAHAVAAKATLVTNDKAFSLVVPKGVLAVEDWTIQV